MQVDNAAVLRLRVIAEAEPSALVRALQPFQMRNLVPRRVVAHRIDVDRLQIDIDVDASECTPDAFRLALTKLNELPVVFSASAAHD
jgi:hypothetical protein